MNNNKKLLQAQNDQPEKKSLAETMRDFVLREKVEFGFDEEKNCYARLWHKGHFEVLALNSSDFIDYLMNLTDKNRLTLVVTHNSTEL